jgi:hypothetical protein
MLICISSLISLHLYINNIEFFYYYNLHFYLLLSLLFIMSLLLSTTIIIYYHHHWPGHHKSSRSVARWEDALLRRSSSTFCFRALNCFKFNWKFQIHLNILEIRCILQNRAHFLRYIGGHCCLDNQFLWSQNLLNICLFV